MILPLVDLRESRENVDFERLQRYVVEPRIDGRLGLQQRVGRQDHKFRVGRGIQPAWKLHGSGIDAIYLTSHLRSYRSASGVWGMRCVVLQPCSSTRCWLRCR